MAFAYTVSLDDESGVGSSEEAAVIACVNAAASDWSRYISGAGSLAIDVTLSGLASGVLATGGPQSLVPVGTEDGRTLADSSAMEALGSTPGSGTIDIDVNAAMLGSFDLSTNPAAAVPANQFSLFSVLLHEMMHGFGMIGLRSTATGALGTAETPFDHDVSVSASGSASFVGANAEAVYGGPVPITTLHNGEQYYHLGNGNDAASSDLMSGLGLAPGTTVGISPLDLAILQDIGLTLTTPAEDSVNYFVGVLNAGNPLVDNTYYDRTYPDVAAAGVDPWAHYETFGWHEGRNPDSLFDTRWYLQTYRDVAAAGVDPLVHYETDGWKEGRDPGPAFSTSAYLANNPDVAAAGVDPLLHYLEFGQHEGRAIYASTASA